MAKVTLQPGFEDLRGAIGDLVFKKSPQGKLIVTKRPDMSKVKWSKAQKASRSHFKEANAYARAAMADPEASLYYIAEAEKAGRQPYRLAMSDYFAGNNRLEEKD